MKTNDIWDEDIYIDGFMVQIEKTDYGLSIQIVDHDTLETLGFWEDCELKAYNEDLQRNKKLTVGKKQ